MIQRAQTLYLALVALLLAILFFLPLALAKIAVTGNEFIYQVYLSHSQPIIGEPVSGKGFIIRVFYASVLLLLAVITIFLYRKRSLQMKLIRFSIVLNILLGITVFFRLGSDFQHFYQTPANISYEWASCLPVVTLILFNLAFRGVKKDEELVRSADRLR